LARRKEDKERLRAAYIFESLDLEQAARQCQIPPGTASRWKRQARGKGDDWDKQRAANLLAGEGVEAIARQMLADYINQHKAVMDALIQDSGMSAADKTRCLASLADSFNKTVAASRRVLPEVSEMAVALQVIKLLQEFILTKFPQHKAAFLDILEPFGQELSRAYG
jgi:hypothetical protein